MESKQSNMYHEYDRRIDQLVDEIIQQDVGNKKWDENPTKDEEYQTHFSVSHVEHIIESMKHNLQSQIDDLRNELRTAKEEIHELKQNFDQPKQYSGTSTRDLTNSKRSLLRGPSSRRTRYEEEIESESMEMEEYQAPRYELEQDFYTLMMLTKMWSFPWFLGGVSIFFQITLGVLTIIDQLKSENFSTFLNIPVKSETNIRIAQVMVIVLSSMTQTDLLVGLRNMLLLPYQEKTHWGVLIGKDEKHNFGMWVFRIFLPLLMKISQGGLILFATFLVIIQSDDSVNLLKDFSALFVISSVDDLFFLMADIGYFGQSISSTAQIAKNVHIVKSECDSDKKSELLKRRLQLQQVLGLIFINLIMLGFWTYITVGQNTGKYIKEMYPNCDFNTTFNGTEFKDFMNNDVCDFPIGQVTNILSCGWDGGDCIDINQRYPNCDVPEFAKLSNGICDGGLYNSKACGFDAGDCLQDKNSLEARYPKCDVEIPGIVGDGFCDGGEYHQIDCGLDGGDCIACLVEDNNLLKNGVCDGGFYALEECSRDGGDCDRCFVEDVFNINDGICDEGDYNTDECSFDGGDCVPSTQVIGKIFKGALKWWVAILADNGSIYGIPYHATQVLKFDPIERQTTLIGGSVGDTQDKWSGGVLGQDGFIYGVPYRTNSILRIDPNSDTTSLVAEGHNLLTPDRGFGSGVVAENGIIYFIPYNYNRVVKFDPANKENPLVEIGDDLGSDTQKWWGGILGPDGNIYGIPVKTRKVLKINVREDTITFIGDGDPNADLMKWFDGTLAQDGNIYVCPYATGQIMQINLEEETTRLVGPDFGEKMFCGGFVARDGFLYGTPIGMTTFVIRFDPISQTATNVTLDNSVFPQDGSGGLSLDKLKWGFKSVLGNDGFIYSVPLSEGQVLAIGPVKSKGVN